MYLLTDNTIQLKHSDFNEIWDTRRGSKNIRHVFCISAQKHV